MGFFWKSSQQSLPQSPAQLQEWVTQHAQQTQQALARSSRAKEQADQFGEQINQIVDRLGEKGTTMERLKWRVKARVRYAHTGIEGAHQEAPKAELQLKRCQAQMNETFDPRTVERLTEAAEAIAAKSEAYLQAVRVALKLWTDLERQTQGQTHRSAFSRSAPSPRSTTARWC